MHFIGLSLGRTTVSYVNIPIIARSVPLLGVYIRWSECGWWKQHLVLIFTFQEIPLCASGSSLGSVAYAGNLSGCLPNYMEFGHRTRYIMEIQLLKTTSLPFRGALPRVRCRLCRWWHASMPAYRMLIACFVTIRYSWNTLQNDIKLFSYLFQKTLMASCECGSNTSQISPNGRCGAVSISYLNLTAPNYFIFQNICSAFVWYTSQGWTVNALNKMIRLDLAWLHFRIYLFNANYFIIIQMSA